MSEAGEAGLGRGWVEPGMRQMGGEGRVMREVEWTSQSAHRAAMCSRILLKRLISACASCSAPVMPCAQTN